MTMTNEMPTITLIKPQLNGKSVRHTMLKNLTTFLLPLWFHTMYNLLIKQTRELGRQQQASQRRIDNIFSFLVRLFLSFHIIKMAHTHVHNIHA